MRAKTRAVAATAGTALVVVPLTGAAAVALVGQTDQGPTTPDQMVVAEVHAELSAQVGDASTVIVASSEAEYEFDKPTITVKEDPPPAPRTSYSGSSRPVANSANVAQAIAGSAIIAEAAKYVGTPYRHGGASPSGFDCSGFVSYVYSKFGISLPRSSGAYYSVGTRVSSPKPGDILVSPGHVGLYAGPNLQIDSPRPGKTIQFRGIWQSSPIYVRVTG